VLQILFWEFLLKLNESVLLELMRLNSDRNHGGRKAKDHLKKLIEESDWHVKVELDIQHRDKYGRTLAYLWDKQGRMINYMMVRDGFALIYTIPPNVKYIEWFIEAQKLARQEKKGIWRKDGLEEKPSEWRKKIPAINNVLPSKILL